MVMFSQKKMILLLLFLNVPSVPTVPMEGLPRSADFSPTHSLITEPSQVASYPLPVGTGNLTTFTCLTLLDVVV